MFSLVLGLLVSGALSHRANAQGFALKTNMLYDASATINLGVEIGLVVGGGNFWRGRSSGEMDRVRADQMGMLATTINSLALCDTLQQLGVKATVMKYIGKSEYTFNVPQDVVEKEVHWYLMMADNYYSKPQREEYFIDSGYYKYHEAYHLLKFSNEKQILEQAYQEYLNLRKNKQWIKPR